MLKIAKVVSHAALNGTTKMSQKVPGSFWISLLVSERHAVSSVLLWSTLNRPEFVSHWSEPLRRSEYTHVNPGVVQTAGPRSTFEVV